MRRLSTMHATAGQHVLDIELKRNPSICMRPVLAVLSLVYTHLHQHSIPFSVEALLTR